MVSSLRSPSGWGPMWASSLGEWVLALRLIGQEVDSGDSICLPLKSGNKTNLSVCLVHSLRIYCGLTALHLVRLSWLRLSGGAIRCLCYLWDNDDIKKKKKTPLFVPHWLANVIMKRETRGFEVEYDGNNFSPGVGHCNWWRSTPQRWRVLFGESPRCPVTAYFTLFSRSH